MSQEATITASLGISKIDATTNITQISYQSRPSAFKADVSGAKGPTPGAISATTNGTDIDFSQLTTPGLCRIMNLDVTNYITVGVWEPDTSKFYPVMELKPGETYVHRWSRSVKSEWSGTGTSVVDTNNTIRIKAANAPCNVLVETFEA